MSKHEFFRRVPVPQQVAQRLETVTFPAPTRGLIQNENEAYMQPGGAVVCDNWRPTLKGVALRGGCQRYCDIHSLDAPTWVTAHAYTVGNTARDAVDGTFWTVAVAHTSGTGTFKQDRIAHPTYWTANAALNSGRKPIISAFQYASGNNQRMYAAQPTKVFDVTTTTPSLVASGRNSGNYCASQMANQGGDFMLVTNDAGDPILRYDGVSWETLSVGYVPPGGKPSMITGPAGTPVVNGQNLTQVCKYRNRFFFIGLNSMSAWYLPINAAGGVLAEIPLSGAATKGGKLLFCASWSIDAGDGIDDKLCFVTDLGELLVFTGSNPADAANWRQEGRYNLSPPLGMNAHLAVGGDLLVATVDGILPVSGAITKDRAELELAAITRPIKPMWREQVLDKRDHPWTMCKWDEYGGIFVSLPGDNPGKWKTLAVNAATGAWARYTGWDAQCFIRMRGDMFFGTQSGVVMQADRTGYDDGMPYVATLVGGWEVFQSPAQTITWRQARASFSARQGEPFQPQLAGCTDYVVTLPPPPQAGVDPGVLDLWDEGLWDVAHWDAAMPVTPVVRNTGWVSIGITGFSHAPIVQVTVAQAALPKVDLIAISAVFERAGINV